MTCRYCGLELKWTNNWANTGIACWVDSMYGYQRSVCSKISHNYPPDSSNNDWAGSWHYPDETYEVKMIMEKYDTELHD